MAPAKLSQAVRRNELLLLASLLAGLLMALFEMVVGLLLGEGLWAFPGYVSATVFRSLQAGGTLTFSMPQIAAGMGLHLALAVVIGALFGWIGPRLREATGLEGVDETPAYSLLGVGFGLTVFAVAWWGVLPYANPIMIEGMDPTFFAIAHGIWGLCLGATRRAWTQTAPQVTRRASTSPQPTPAASGHKAPSGATTPPPSATQSEAEADVATLEPEEPEEEAASAEAADEDEDPVSSSSDDELSPWPDPPEETPSETNGSGDGSSSTDEGYASTSPREETDEGDDEDEDEGLAMTEHARRSLRGLTNREPDLPPVHKQLETTLTHVAPGRAVCTIDADERLHDATGAVQSGVLISLAELAATIAMETVAPEAEHATVASEIQVQGSVEEGHVVAEAEVTEQAGTTTLAEAEVRDASGKVLVEASFQAATDDE